MKLLLATPALALALACASEKKAAKQEDTTNVTTAYSSTGAVPAPAQDCGKMVRKVAAPKSYIRDAPGPDANMIAQLQNETPICVATDAYGTGYLQVKLDDGRQGYIAEANLH
jgi:hypothetical protein